MYRYIPFVLRDYTVLAGPPGPHCTSGGRLSRAVEVGRGIPGAGAGVGSAGPKPLRISRSAAAPEALGASRPQGRNGEGGGRREEGLGLRRPGIAR